MSLVNQFVHKTILQDTKEQYINDQIIVRFRYCQRMANNNGTPLLAHSQILAFPLVMLLSFSAFFVYSVFRACFSLMRMTSLVLSLFTKGFGPLRAHFSLLGYKKMEGSKALLTFFGLPKLFCIRFAQVVRQQICFGLFPFSVLFWVILGPQLLFLKDAPSRGFLSVHSPFKVGWAILGPPFITLFKCSFAAGHLLHIFLLA